MSKILKIVKKYIGNERNSFFRCKKGGFYIKETLLLSTNLYEEAERRLKELTKVQTMLRKRRKNHPEGKIHIVRNKGRFQYYLRLDARDKSGIYLPQNESNLIRKLLQKKYEEEVLFKIELEIRNLEQFIKKSISKDTSGTAFHMNSINESIQSIYSDYPEEIRNQIIPIDIGDDDFAAKWMAIPFVPKPIRDCPTIQITDKEEQVRSKSELNIANALFRLNIPYKYECPLILRNRIVIYPDFSVADVRRRRIVYWEHRGMMDDREYAKGAVQRVRDYEEDGIFPGDRLIITEETLQNPLSTAEILRIIEHYFLA